MRCPKCGYISFDFNQVCPKCTKDVSAEQAKFNIPAFRPDPLSLLGALTGEANESNLGLRMDSSAALGQISPEIDINMDDSSSIDAGDLGFDESQDLDMGFDQEGFGEVELEGETEELSEEALPDIDLEGREEEISFDTDDISFSDSGAFAMPETGAEEDAISLDLDGLPSEGPESGEARAEPAEEGEEPAIDLDEIPLDERGQIAIETKESADLDAFTFETGDAEVEPKAGAELDLGDFSLEESGPLAMGAEESFDIKDFAAETGNRGAGSDKGEIELDLDDLKVNETGELEIGTSSSRRGEPSLNMEDLTLDEPLSEGEKPEDLDKGMSETPIDLEEISLTEEPVPEAARKKELAQTLDLENLDIKLELKEPEKNSI